MWPNPTQLIYLLETRSTTVTSFDLLIVRYSCLWAAMHILFSARIDWWNLLAWSTRCVAHDFPTYITIHIGDLLPVSTKGDAERELLVMRCSSCCAIRSAALQYLPHVTLFRNVGQKSCRIFSAESKTSRPHGWYWHSEHKGSYPRRDGRAQRIWWLENREVLWVHDSWWQWVRNSSGMVLMRLLLVHQNNLSTLIPIEVVVGLGIWGNIKTYDTSQ